MKERLRMMLETQMQRLARESCHDSAVDSGASSQQRGSSSWRLMGFRASAAAGR